MRERIRGVGKLVYKPGIFGRIGDCARQVHVVVRVFLIYISARDADIGSKTVEVLNLLRRHLVGDDDDQAVTAGSGYKGKAEAGVPGCGFDDDASRPESP